jgi:hypothetical protein
MASHAPKVRVPPIKATRTSQNAALSASRWPGAFGVLGFLDEGHDLGQCGVGADFGGADTQGAGGVD